MDLIIEFIMEFIFETGIEVSKNNAVPKWIRILVGTIIALFFTAVILILLVIAIENITSNYIAAIILFAFAIGILIYVVFEINKVYKSLKNKK